MTTHFDFFEGDRVSPVIPIEQLTLENEAFRRVYSTTEQQQLVFMALQPREEIGLEIHQFNTQFFRIEQGHGLAILNGQEFELRNGDSITVPANTPHNVVNVSPNEMLKLYTIYAPPKHAPGLLQYQKPKPFTVCASSRSKSIAEQQEEQDESEEAEEYQETNQFY